MAITNIPHPATLGGVGGGAGAYPSIQADPFRFKTEDDQLLDMIASRMRWNQPDPFMTVTRNMMPFHKISAHKLNAETVVVFVINKGKALLIEDGAALFPSDTLITQLRLLAEAGK